MKTIHFFIVFLLIKLQLFAQSPDTAWTKTFGGQGNDKAYSVKQTSDGGFIIAGNTDSFGAGLDDIWLIKTDEYGDTAWTRTYGGSEYDYCYDVHQTSDGGYILFGETNSFHPTFWAGYVIKTNFSGDTLWTKAIGENRHYFARSGLEIPGGDYIFTGRTKSSGAGQEDLWLVKINAFGDTVWTKSYGGLENEQGVSFKRTNDGGFIIAGVTNTYGAGDYDAWLIRMDAGFDTIWTRTYGGTNSDYAQSVLPTDDGGFIFGGMTRSFGIPNNYNDVWIVKTDLNGDTLWTKTFGSSSHCGALDVQYSSNEGYIFVGYNGLESFNNDVWLIKLDKFGDTEWTELYGGDQWDVGRSLDQTSDGGLIIAGEYYDNVTSTRDVYLLKIAPEPTSIELSNLNSKLSEYKLYQNYPNPFNPNTKIKFSLPDRQAGISASVTLSGVEESHVTLRIYDILGNEIVELLNEVKSTGIYEIEFDGSGFSSGVYFYQLKAGELITTKKLMLLK